MEKFCSCGRKIANKSKGCRSCSNRNRPKPDTLNKDIARFKSKVVVMDSGCWLLKGQEAGKGYAYVSIRQKSHGAHRVALFIYKGNALDTPLLAMHSCDNPRCVNPEHIKYGTQTDNMRDASIKGRIRNASDWVGLKNPKAKLNPDLHPEIIKSVCVGVSRKILAERYGVSVNRISQILGSK